MSKTLLAALIVATISSSAMPGRHAAAMPSAHSLSGVATPTPIPVAIVCSVGGCAPLNVKRAWHQPHGFAKRAAPLNTPAANPLPPSNAAAAANK